MAYSKIKKILFVLLCCFIILFPFWCVRGLCAEFETVEIEGVNGLRITMDSNYFTSVTGSAIATFNAEPGYKYTITTNATTTRIIVTSSEYPELNGIYNIIGTINPSESTSFSFIVNSNTQISLNGNKSGYTVQREKLEGMNSTISDLVDNVGFNSIWNIFDISINYIVIVVVFALGCFIIFKLIKKVSKGKEGF